ncbi:hypothetical protein D0T85_22460 [Bacteroides sp. 519]|nr:hypothetical protein [Bacteroides sp. 519]
MLASYPECDADYRDMFAENSKGELVIIEVQNNRELDYFHRMLYVANKAMHRLTLTYCGEKSKLFY